MRDPFNSQIHKDLGNSLRRMKLAEFLQSNGEGKRPKCEALEEAFDELSRAVDLAELQHSAQYKAEAYLDKGKTFEACGDISAAREAVNASLDAKAGYQFALEELDVLKQMEREN